MESGCPTSNWGWARLLHDKHPFAPACLSWYQIKLQCHINFTDSSGTLLAEASLFWNAFCATTVLLVPIATVCASSFLSLLLLWPGTACSAECRDGHVLPCIAPTGSLMVSLSLFVLYHSKDLVFDVLRRKMLLQPPKHANIVRTEAWWASQHCCLYSDKRVVLCAMNVWKMLKIRVCN